MRVGFVRVPKTGTTHMTTKMRVTAHWENTEICAGHVKASELQGHDHPHLMMTMVRDPYQTSLSMYYMIRRMASAPDFDQKQAERIALDPEKKNRFVHTPHYEHNLAVARDPDVGPDEWLELSAPNCAMGFHFDTMTPTEFDFVGHVDEMDRSDDLLASMVKTYPVIGIFDNENPDKPKGAHYPEGKFTESMFQKTNALEYELFDLGMERSRRLCKKYDL